MYFFVFFGFWKDLIYTELSEDTESVQEWTVWLYLDFIEMIGEENLLPMTTISAEEPVI